MASPDISQQANYQDGNSVFDSVFILEKLDYDFTKSGPITVSELNVIGISTFSSDVTFGGDISLDEITCRNADVTGIATVSGNLSSSGNITSTAGALSGFDAVISEKVPDISGAAMDFISANDNGKVLSYDYNFDLTLLINDGLGEGFNCLIVQKGVGKIIFEAMPDKNVVLINRQGHNKTAGQYAVVSIINIGKDENNNDLILIGGDTGL